MLQLFVKRPLHSRNVVGFFDALWRVRALFCGAAVWLNMLNMPESTTQCLLLLLIMTIMKMMMMLLLMLLAGCVHNV